MLLIYFIKNEANKTQQIKQNSKKWGFDYFGF